LAGIEEIMVEITEIVDYIKNPKIYNEMGITTPKGVLLAGPPGVGKTLLAKAVASEAGANFIFSSASEFDERYVGVGASRIRGMFAKAKADRPAIIFIDEIDTIGYKRYQSINNSYEQTLNQLLTEMDGFEKNVGIVVIAATNRIDVLDEALLRPGRFDRHIVMSKPDLDARLKILQVHSRNKKLSPEALEALPQIAAQTFGFSGADLANLLNEAGFHAIRENKTVIDQSDIESALERILGGISRKTTINRREKDIVAHHEAGHALAAYLLSEENPVTKISIIARRAAWA
jgi:cell division protease FtsH